MNLISNSEALRSFQTKLLENKGRCLAIIVLLVILGSVTYFFTAFFQITPKIEVLYGKAGIVDADGKFLAQQRTVYSLNGEWEFYEGQLIEPTLFEKQEITSYVEIPHSWGIEPRYGIFGSASYRITLNNMPINKALALQIPFAYTANRVFIDGEEKSNSGNPHEIKRLHEPNYISKTIFHTTQTGTMEVLIHVSNYDHVFTGIPSPIFIAIASHLDIAKITIYMLNFWIVAILLFYSLLFMATYIITPDQEGYLYYSIIAFVTAVRSLCVAQPTLAYYLTQVYRVPAENILRVEYLATSFILFFIFLYLGSRYSELKKYVTFFNLIQIVLAFFLLFGEIYQITIVCKVLAAVGSVGHLILLLTAFFNKNIVHTKLMLVELAGFLLIFVCALIDLFGIVSWYSIDITGAAIAVNCCIQIILFISLFRQREVQLSKLSEDLEQLVDERTRNLMDTNKMLSFEIDTRRNAEMEMKKISIQDPLSHAYNRSYILDLVRSYIEDAQKDENFIFSIILLDIDKLKYVNETQGYAVGDRVLKNFAKTLLETFTMEGALARYNSDQFLFLTLQCDLEKAEMLARKMKNVVRQTAFISGQPNFFITCSTGVAQFSESDTVETLVKRADLSLVEEKNIRKSPGFFY